MHAYRRRHYRWLRHIPRRKHLKGGRLHRWFGEGIFAPELWRPTRRGVAGGLALGIFVGFTPTMGVQLILAGAAAFLLKVNVPMALAGSLVTNPFTAPLIYPLEYRLGVWLIGPPEPAEWEAYTGMLRSFVRYAKPLWAGSLVFASAAAAFVYGLVTLLWVEAEHLRGRK